MNCPAVDTDDLEESMAPFWTHVVRRATLGRGRMPAPHGPPGGSPEPNVFPGFPIALARVGKGWSPRATGRRA
jgi:hypothetical protein